MNTLTAKNKQGLGLSQSNGFTIIEVVLVLAIAALIFLMVFIALPALQRNQRDTARKTIVGKVASAITSYQSNNRGINPANAKAIKGYVDGKDIGTGNDTQIENEYTINIAALPAGGDTPGSAANDFVQVYTKAKCADDQKATGGTSRQAAVIIKLENGDALLCQSV